MKRMSLKPSYRPKYIFLNEHFKYFGEIFCLRLLSCLINRIVFDSGWRCISAHTIRHAQIIAGRFAVSVDDDSVICVWNGWWKSQRCKHGYETHLKSTDQMMENTEYSNCMSIIQGSSLRNLTRYHTLLYNNTQHQNCHNKHIRCVIHTHFLVCSLRTHPYSRSQSAGE